MLEIFATRSHELMRHLTLLSAQLPQETDSAARATIQQTQRETRGRLSVYTPALARITTTEAAREYLEKVSAEAVHLLHDIGQPDETLSETEAAAPIVSGFYHEARYALALLGCADYEGRPKE